MAEKTDDLVIGVSTDMSSVQRAIKKLDGDISRAGSQIEKSFASIGRGIDKSMTTALQSRINEMVGIGTKGAKEWGGALAEQGKVFEQLRSKYNPLFAAQKTYLANLKDIKTAHAIGAISANEMAAAIVREKAAFASNVTVINGTKKGLGQVAGAAKLTSNQMLNLSRQGNDVITMFALGAPPMQIFASQAGQIYDALESGPGGIKGSLKAIGESVLGLVTRFPLATAAIVATGAAVAAYAFLADDKVKSVDDVLKRHEENIKRLGPAYADALKSVQKFADESERLANLRFRVDAADALKTRAAEAQTAIENIVKSEGIFSSRFSGAKDAIEAFMASIRAGNPEAAKFQETIAQLAASGRITEEVARDLITASDAAYKAELALRGVAGSTNEAAKAIADMAKALEGDAASRLSRLTDEQRKYVQGLIDQLKAGEISAKDFKAALAALSGVTPDFSGAIAEISGLADQLERAQKAALGLANTTPKQDRVGFNRMDDAQSQYDDAMQMWRRFGYDNDSGVDPNKPKKTKAAKAPRKTADDRFFEDIEAIRQRTIALAEEQAQLSLSFEAQTKRKVAFDLEQKALKDVREAARQKGDQDWQNAELTPKQIAQINEVSSAYAKQADELRKAQEVLNLQKDVVRGLLGDMQSALADGKLEWEELGNIAINALNKITDKLLNDVVDAIFQVNNAAGSGGGILGSILGLFTGGGGGFNPTSGGFASMLGLPKYANGTNNHPGGLAVVGERGPELLNLPRGSQVLPRVPKAMGAGGGGISVDARTTIDARGADAAAIARLETAQRKRDAELPARITEQIRKINNSNIRTR